MSLDMLLQYDINVYAILFLIVILFTVYVKKGVHNFSTMMFKIIIITNIAMLILEILSWVFDGVDGQLAWYLNYSFNFALVLLTPVIAGLWASYVEFKIFKSTDRLKKFMYFQQPFLIGLVLSIINLFVPILFKVSEDNIYSREPLIWINVATMYLLLMHTIAMAYRHRKKMNQNLLLGVAIFFIFPIAGAVIQMLYLGTLLIWPMIALGVVIVYIFLETISPARDHLTNLFTRVKSDEYIKDLIDKNTDFTVIMIDIDNFKEINDDFGHIAGDKVLKDFGAVLMSVFSDKSMVSRFGGDEFLVVTKFSEEEELLNLKKSLYDEITNPTYENKNLLELRFGYGYSFFKQQDIKTMDQLVIEADKLMYKDKAINKNYKRRKSDR